MERRYQAELRETKRALWLARARTAHCEWQLFVKEAVEPDATGEEADKAEQMALKWQNVERKCRAMAEKYGEVK